MAPVVAIVTRVEHRDRRHARGGKPRRANRRVDIFRHAVGAQRDPCRALHFAAAIQDELGQRENVDIVRHKLSEFFTATRANGYHARDARGLYLFEDLLAVRRSAVEEPRAHERTSAAIVGHAPFESRGGKPFAHAAGQIGRVAHERAPGEEHRVKRSRLVRRRIAQCDDFGISDAEDGAVGAEDVPFVVDHRELFGLVEPRLHEQLAPVAHTVGGEHVNRAVRRAVTAETAAAKRVVHVVIRLHKLGHRGGALVSGKGHNAVVRFLDRAHIEARLLEHLASKRTALAMRAPHLLVRPA